MVRSGQRLAPPGPAAEAEQAEHDRYFAVTRKGTFATGLVDAFAAVHANAVTMGLTLLDDAGWTQLHDGLHALPAPTLVTQPAPPRPAGWRRGYDPTVRWLVGHQLFFALIQGTIIGLNCFWRDRRSRHVRRDAGLDWRPRSYAAQPRP